MKKEELIVKVSELETKLKKADIDKNNLLSITSKLIKGERKNPYSYGISINNNSIETLEELFFEIGKLVEFRDNILSNLEYERNNTKQIKELEFLRNKFDKEINKSIDNFN